MMDMYKYAKQLEHDKKFEQALKWLYKFLDLKEQHNIAKRESAIKDIGAVLHKLGRTKEAIEFLKSQRHDIKKVGPYLQFISNLMFQMLPRPDDLYPRVVWIKPHPYSFYFQGNESIQALRDFVFAIFPSYQSKIGDVSFFIKDKTDRNDVRVSVTFHTHSSAVKASMKYMSQREIVPEVDAITWENDKEMNFDFNRKPNSRAKKNQLRAENVTSSFMPRKQTDPSVQHIERDITEIVLSMQQNAHKRQTTNAANWYARGRKLPAKNFFGNNMDEEGQEELLEGYRDLHWTGDTIAMQLCPQKQKNSTIHIPLVPILREQLSYLLQLGMTLDAPPLQARRYYTTKTRQEDDDQSGLDVRSLCTIAPPPGLGSPISMPCSSPMEAAESTDPTDSNESDENADPMLGSSSSQTTLLPPRVIQLLRQSLNNARLDRSSLCIQHWMSQFEKIAATSRIILAEPADQDTSEPAKLFRKVRKNKHAAFVEVASAMAKGRVGSVGGIDKVPGVLALLAATLDLETEHEEWNQEVDAAQELLRQTLQLKVWKATREEQKLAHPSKNVDPEAWAKEQRQHQQLRQQREPRIQNEQDQQPKLIEQEKRARIKHGLGMHEEKEQLKEQNEEPSSSSGESFAPMLKKQLATLNVHAPEFIPNSIPTPSPVPAVNPFTFRPQAQEFVPSSSSSQQQLDASTVEEALPRRSQDWSGSTSEGSSAPLENVTTDRMARQDATKKQATRDLRFAAVAAFFHKTPPPPKGWAETQQPVAEALSRAHTEEHSEENEDNAQDHSEESNGSARTRSPARAKDPSPHDAAKENQDWGYPSKGPHQGDPYDRSLLDREEQKEKLLQALPGRRRPLLRRNTAPPDVREVICFDDAGDTREIFSCRIPELKLNKLRRVHTQALAEIYEDDNDQDADAEEQGIVFEDREDIVADNDRDEDLATTTARQVRVPHAQSFFEQAAARAATFCPRPRYQRMGFINDRGEVSNYQ